MENNKSVTAVEWLADNIMPIRYHFTLEYRNNFIKFIEQAKEMEKEQITLSHINGQSEFDTEKFRQYNKDLAEAYYNQTFKSK